MASQSKSDAARANGAKSRGPITHEGKARSSQNALKHGLTASFCVLPGESEQDFETLLEAHRTQHQPATALEEELVRNLAVARWRLARVAAIETHLFDNEMARSQEQIDGEFPESDDLGRLAFVFRKLADQSHALSLLIRYENSLTRTCDRAFKHLLTVQKLRNEPKPKPQEPVQPRTDVSSFQPSNGNRPGEARLAARVGQTVSPAVVVVDAAQNIKATESGQITREGASPWLD
jgi:hypothetical protein